MFYCVFKLSTFFESRELQNTPKIIVKILTSMPKNIIMKEYTENEYEEIYPKTILSQVTDAKDYIDSVTTKLIVQNTWTFNNTFWNGEITIQSQFVEVMSQCNFLIFELVFCQGLTITGPSSTLIRIGSEQTLDPNLYESKYITSTPYFELNNRSAFLSKNASSKRVYINSGIYSAGKGVTFRPVLYNTDAPISFGIDNGTKTWHNYICYKSHKGNSNFYLTGQVIFNIYRL